eukprot:2694477-Pyramimonas_sp.AAC.1
MINAFKHQRSRGWEWLLSRGPDAHAYPSLVFSGETGVSVGQLPPCVRAEDVDRLQEKPPTAAFKIQVQLRAASYNPQSASEERRRGPRASM